MTKTAAIILAAGKGTRMKSSLPKVLHPVCGRPMITYPVRALKEYGASRIIVVVGHGAEGVKEALSGEKGIVFAEQREQLGTGHAVLCAAGALAGFKGDCFIISGDVPLLTAETLAGLKSVHSGERRKKAALSLVTALVDDPTGYGRILRDDNNAVAGIVEEKDATVHEKRINEINTGTYLVDAAFLLDNLERLGKDNAQKEYYLTDLVRMAALGGQKVSAFTTIRPEEVMGVNNRVELARAGQLMRRRVLERLMLSGVTVIDPEHTYIDPDVEIGADTVIYPGSHIKGAVKIGANCVIEEGVVIEGSTINGGTTVKSYSIIEGSAVGSGVVLGPFARLRPGSVVGDNARVGNFVEIKKSTIGKGSKANHLSYLGDSVIGEGVNIGAGTITCNYDGVDKFTTVIEDGAFIGSDSQLVAPVKIGKGAYVGSGTTVTKDVPPGSLVITRANERVIEGWVERKFKDRKKKKKH